MLHLHVYGRDPYFDLRGPGHERIATLSGPPSKLLWEAGNLTDIQVIEAIQRFDADDRYIVVEVKWERRAGFLRRAHGVTYWRFDRHGPRPWSPTDLGVLIKPE